MWFTIIRVQVGLLFAAFSFLLLSTSEASQGTQILRNTLNKKQYIKKDVYFINEVLRNGNKFLISLAV